MHLAVNFQQSLDKLNLLTQLEEKLKENDCLISIAIKHGIRRGQEPPLAMIKDMARDNPEMMEGIVGKHLLSKILIT